MRFRCLLATPVLISFAGWIALSPCITDPPTSKPAGPGRLTPVADHHQHLLGPAALPPSPPMLPVVEVPADLEQLLEARAKLYAHAQKAEECEGRDEEEPPAGRGRPLDHSRNRVGDRMEIRRAQNQRGMARNGVVKQFCFRLAQTVSPPRV